MPTASSSASSLRDLSAHVLRNRELDKMGFCPADSSKLSCCLRNHFPGVNWFQLEELLRSVETELQNCELKSTDVPDTIVKYWIKVLVVPKFSSAFSKTFSVHLRRIVKRRINKLTQQSRLESETYSLDSEASPSNPLIKTNSIRSDIDKRAAFEKDLAISVKDTTCLRNIEAPHVRPQVSLPTSQTAPQQTAQQQIQNPAQMQNPVQMQNHSQQIPSQSTPQAQYHSLDSHMEYLAKLTKQSPAVLSKFSCSPSLEDIRTGMEKFVEDRKWSKFHTPRNLALAMVSLYCCWSPL